MMSDLDVNTSREARQKRLDLHRAVWSGDEDAVHRIIYELFVSPHAPLRAKKDMHNYYLSWAVLVEVAIIAKHLDKDSEFSNDLMLNLRHTYTSFQIPVDEYELLVTQIKAADNDFHATDWAVGTCLHGYVKPWRHVEQCKGYTATQ